MRSVASLGLIAAGVLVACSPVVPSPTGTEIEPSLLSPVSLEAGTLLHVVATTTIVGDIVRQVGGEAIQLTVLLPPGIDPHTFQPRPSDLRVVTRAHVLFVNGMGLESFLQEMLANAGGDSPVVSVSASLSGLETAHDHDETDPHVWLDVRNVMIWVDSIEAALTALDPARADEYAANAAAVRERLQALDAWILERVATVPQAHRKLVTAHPSFTYFADRYGFEQVGTVYPSNPSAEPSAQDIARLEAAIAALNVPAIFAENTVNVVLAEQVAQDTGIPLVALYSGSLGELGSGVDSYVALMEYDVRAIVTALGGTVED